jgi:hypothetical protein
VLHDTSPRWQFLPVGAVENILTAEELAARAMALALLPASLRFLCYHIEAQVDSWAVAHIAPVLIGNVDAAISFALALSNDQRGGVAVALWEAKIPVPAYRAFLESVWTGDHDYRAVINAAKTRRRLQAMFRYAKFDTSSHPDIIRVWRGTWGIGIKAATTGFSWTTDRDLACWFAMRMSARSPLVLMAEVPRETIACYTNERGEKEVVLFTPPAAVVDGTEAEWAERYHAVQSKRNAERKILES